MISIEARPFRSSNLRSQGTTANETVDRQKLSAALLSDPAGFSKLESIVHPLVRDAERHFLQAEAARSANLAVLEIPLLYETASDRLVDVVIVVSADAETQAARVFERPGMTRAKLNQILSRQLSDDEKRARADFVVDTGGPISQSQGRTRFNHRVAAGQDWRGLSTPLGVSGIRASLNGNPER